MKSFFSVGRYVVGAMLWRVVLFFVRTPIFNNLILSIAVAMLLPFLITYFYALDFDESGKKINFICKKYKEQFPKDFMAVALGVVFSLYYCKIISGLCLGTLIVASLASFVVFVLVFNHYHVRKLEKALKI